MLIWNIKVSDLNWPSQVNLQKKMSSQNEDEHGHSFDKKTFHKPTYCHHCSDMLWGITNQGNMCKVCGFVTHDRCMSNVVIPCTALSLAQVQRPEAHSFIAVSSKSKICNVCRQRTEDSDFLACKCCEYYAHSSCSKDIVHNCKRSAIFHPELIDAKNIQRHHWMEGHLPPSSKCHHCKKICSSSECLTGLRCSWCGTTVHAGCQNNINQCCNFGNFSKLVLPPFYISEANIPLWMTRFAGDTGRKMSVSSDSSHTSSGSSDERHDVCQSDTQDSGVLRIYDGDITNPHGWRNVRVSKEAATPEVLRNALLQFRITEEQNKYYLARAISVNSERRLEDYEKPMNFIRNKKPQLFLRHNSLDIKHGTLTIYRGEIPAKQPSVVIEVNLRTPAWRIVERALSVFEMESAKKEKYCLIELQMHSSGVDERYVDDEECIWEDYIGRRKLSIARTHSTRYYLQPVPNRSTKTSLFVGNLPYNMTTAQYEATIAENMGEFGPECFIEHSFPLYGAAVIQFPSIDSLLSGYFRLKDSMIHERKVYLKLIPNIEETLLPSTSSPLLVFVNGKSGGGQGAKLINFFQRTLNPHQVFDLMEGGPLPGLFSFRKIQNFRILICGGDGTFGWVLSSIDEANKYLLLNCKEPPAALLPLGTGNDLARVLNWGSGYTSSDDLYSLLLSVDESLETCLDRWSIVFDVPASPDSGSSEDEQANVIIMNNYFGIGVDAMLALDFHLAREEQPDKFNSRLRNKGVYFKSGLKNMAKSSNSNLQDKIDVEVDGKLVNIPNIEGLLISNISSWAGGSDPWGKDRDTKFKQPTYNDGLVELMGFTGVVHMGRIKSGLSSAIRIAQGSQVNIKIKAVIPMQIDGEPWMQQPCDIVLRPTVQQAKMLAKNIPIRKRLSSKTLSQKSTQE